MTMRFADVILCFPPILLAMLVAGFLGGGVGYLILIIGFLYLPQFSRLAFAQTLAVRQAEFVEAARASGASPVGGFGDAAGVGAQFPRPRRAAARALLGGSRSRLPGTTCSRPATTCYGRRWR